MTSSPNISPDRTSASPSALTFDPAPYHHFLNDCDWTEAQKNEFINELWKIIVGFVDLGFRVHPVQQVIDETNVEAESVLMLGSTESNNIKLSVVEPFAEAAGKQNHETSHA